MSIDGSNCAMSPLGRQSFASVEFEVDPRKVKLNITSECAGYHTHGLNCSGRDWRECSRMFDSFQHVELVVSVAGKLIKNPNIDGRILQRKMEEGSYLAWENPCAGLTAMRYPSKEIERGRIIASLRIRAI